MAKQTDRKHTQEDARTEELPHADERRLVIEQQVAELRELLKKLRRLFN